MKLSEIAARLDCLLKGRGDLEITGVVGGATDKPLPAAPKKIEPKGAMGGGLSSSLVDAKRRAQQQIKQKEQGE